MKSGRRVCVISTVMVVLAGAGCGGKDKSSSSTSTSAPPPITKAAYIAQANRLCKSYNTQIAAVVGGGQDPSSRAVTRRAVVNLLHENVAAFRALGYPPGDQQTLSPIWDGVDHALDHVEQSGTQDNLEQALGQAMGPFLAKMTAYGIHCQ